MKTALKLTALIAIGTALISLAGCAAGIAQVFSGNRRDNINAAIQTLNERFGTEFKLKSKKMSGGATCNFTAACPETGDKEIYIFQFDKDKAVQTDYIYVRYGAEALEKIRTAAETACPGCKVIVNERVYNHLHSRDYDKNTDLAAYLQNNDFDVDVLMPRMLGKTELEAFYHSLEVFMHDGGIYCKVLTLGCPEDFDSVVPPDHIICTNEGQYSGISSEEYTYSAYCPNYITKNGDAFDSSSPYAVFIDGQRVRFGDNAQ